MNVFKCPNCNNEHSAVIWNEHTAYAFRVPYKSLKPIQLANAGNYKCPSCGEMIFRSRIVETSWMDQLIDIQLKRVKRLVKRRINELRNIHVLIDKESMKSYRRESGKKIPSLVFVPLDMKSEVASLYNTHGLFTGVKFVVGRLHIPVKDFSINDTIVASLFCEINTHRNMVKLYWLDYAQMPINNLSSFVNSLRKKLKITKDSAEIFPQVRNKASYYINWENVFYNTVPLPD